MNLFERMKSVTTFNVDSNTVDADTVKILNQNIIEYLTNNTIK